MTGPTADLAVLELAIESEKGSLENYLDFAWTTTDPAGKNMFIQLAIDEARHMRLLEVERASVHAGGCWQPVEVPRSLVERLIPRLSDTAVRIQGHRGTDQLTALNTALELERSAEEFYSIQRDRTGDESARAVLARLAEMERAHAALIQAELDHIKRTGFWFGTAEFTLETPG